METTKMIFFYKARLGNGPYGRGGLGQGDRRSKSGFGHSLDYADARPGRSAAEMFP